jgi:tetratricopeptide (TPR) repeat protein
MNKSLAAALLLALVLAGCTTAPAPTAPGTGPAASLFDVDPRLGWSGAVDADGWERAMTELRAGRRESAIKRLGELERKSPANAPASLALAALALESGDLAAAASGIEEAAALQRGWTAAEYYLARLAMARDDLEGAAARLRALAADPAAPRAVAARLAEVETRLFDRSYQAAAGAPPAAAIPHLRRALSLRPDSASARLLLVQSLIANRNFSEARVEIDPLLQGAESTKPEVQQALAEIEAGRGRYEEAIERYERIVRADPRPAYLSRLEEIKTEFAVANMPPRFRAAASSALVSRADLATLIYWTVAGIRFGRPPSEPAVAVDIADSEAREEIVRAIAFGLFSVDPVTRRVDPDRTMTATGVARVLHRVMTLTTTAPCAAAGGDGPGAAGIIASLAACGIDTTPLRGDPGAPVTGAWALGALRKIDALRAR